MRVNPKMSSRRQYPDTVVIHDLEAVLNGLQKNSIFELLMSASLLSQVRIERLLLRCCICQTQVKPVIKLHFLYDYNVTSTKDAYCLCIRACSVSTVTSYANRSDYGVVHYTMLIGNAYLRFALHVCHMYAMKFKLLAITKLRAIMTVWSREESKQRWPNDPPQWMASNRIKLYTANR